MVHADERELKRVTDALQRCGVFPRCWPLHCVITTPLCGRIAGSRGPCGRIALFRFFRIPPSISAQFDQSRCFHDAFHTERAMHSRAL